MFGNRGAAPPHPQPATAVARAWRQVLDRRSLAADLPFDQAGGDSLRLLKLVFLLEEDTSLRLPMAACHVGLRPSGFVAVVELARHLSDGRPVEPPGTVFLIPGMGGESLLEGGFVAACAPALHVAVVDLPDWPDMIAPGFNMADVTEQITVEIMARLPEGPVRLAGFSMGGHIAFGVARALATRGRAISFLGFLDTDTKPKPQPMARGPGPIRALRHARWETHNLIRAARNGTAADKLGELTAQMLARPGKTWRLRVAARGRQVKLPVGYAIHVNGYLREILQSRLLRAWQASFSYHSPPLDAPVVLFRSEEHPADVPADLGWTALCPRLRVVDIAGGHRAMLRPPYLDGLRAAFVREAKAAPGVTAARLVA